MEVSRLNTKDIGEIGNIRLTRAGIYRYFAQVYDLLNEPDLVNYYYKKSIRFADSLNLQVTNATTAKFYGG